MTKQDCQKIDALIEKMTLEEKAAFCSGRDFWRTKALERLGIPSVMMCDGPHGLRKQEGEGDHLGIHTSIETVCYPTASALASSFDRQAMRELGAALGEECREEGVSMLLGPGLNIKRSPLCGRNFEYLSEDPFLAGELARAYVESIQSEGVAACAKHFACNNQETKRMTGDSLVDERALREIYLPAFESVVKRGKVKGVMCAYNAVNGAFCSENKLLLTDILRNQWGFDGLTVTDWGAMKDPVKSVEAGLDLEMPGGPNATGETLVRAVREGVLSEEALNRAVKNILNFVFSSVPAEETRKKRLLSSRKRRGELSEKLAGECAVLLKNVGTLPIRKDAAVAFIGEFAEKLRYQGAGSSHVNVPHPVSALEAAEGRNIVYARGYDAHRSETDPALLKEALDAAQNAEVAVIFAGLPDAWETEGIDREHLKMPKNQNALIREVAKVNAHVVVVLHTGAPVELEWLDDVSALLCMYLGGERVGAACVDLLFGTVNPSGHLAETWPLKLADNPSHLNFPGVDGVVTYAESVFVGYRYYDKKEMRVAFPFGYGLSYTDFSYANLRVSQDSILDTDALRVQVDVTNIGQRFGKTAVQLYVRAKGSETPRPLRELKGFEKIGLRPGETATVSFTLDNRAFAYYETKRPGWLVETGEYLIEIGKSSREICLSVPVYVTGTVRMTFPVTPYTTIGQLQKHVKGADLLKRILPSGKSSTETGVMGEGGEQMVRRMMFDMPLSALVSYGRIDSGQLDAIIRQMNEASLV